MLDDPCARASGPARPGRLRRRRRRPRGRPRPLPDTGADRGPLPTVDRGFPDAADRDAAPRPPDAGPPADARVLPDTDPPEPDGAPIDMTPPPFEDPAWPVRTCEIDVTWTGDAADVRLAGDFTGWQAGALPSPAVATASSAAPSAPAMAWCPARCTPTS
ncbi:MAG: hypothetical protein R3F43_28420 [bacterium]